MVSKAVCIHGHFYQPPREDPITGEIAREEGAAPYLNWNEKILQQCYRPNAELGNFERISFNIGPTLINWLLSYDSATLSKIINQERRAYIKNGVGNGMAMAYNHTILPLARPHDKRTQIKWGVEDFRYRFGHAPQGMWLPEAAVDMETLEILADEGIQFTILAPWQAAEYDVDCSKPYNVALKNDRKIAVFFYQEELSMRVSFDPGATSNGDSFIKNYIRPQFSLNGRRDQDELYIIASDGELYGHHQTFRDKFLSYITQADNGEISFTYPALWLKQHPPQEYVKIRDNTSWSCHHGVARWKEACPCGPNGDWKSRLFTAMHTLADAIDHEYIRLASPYIQDPWQLLYRYIDVLHGERSVREWLAAQCDSRPDAEALTVLERVLRAQLNKQKMFTSCGWFFDDFDRIEPRIIVTATAHAIWWLKLAGGEDLIPQATQLLAQVRSWRTSLHGDSLFLQQINRLRYEQLPLPFTQLEANLSEGLTS